MKYILIIILVSLLIPASVESHIENIENSLQNNNYEIAYEKFNVAISEFDANSNLYFTGANIAIKLDKLDDANKYFIKAIELDNKNKNYRKAQENLLVLKNDITNVRKTFDSGRLDQAINEYIELTSKYPNNAIIFYNLGRMYKLNKQYDYAVDNYKIAVKTNPFEEKYKLAIKAIAQQVAKEGDTEYRRQEFDVAIKNYKESISYYPDYTIAYFKLARTYFKIKDYDNAKIYLIKNLLVNPNQEQSEKMLGDVFLRAGEIDSALTHYNNAIKINSNYSKAYYSLGTSLFKINDYAGAKNALQEALVLDSNYAKAYNALGTVYQAQNNFELAVDNFNSCISLDGKSYDSYYRLSSVYNLLEKYELAKTSAKNCLNIKRNYAPAYFELGVSEKALGNNVAASSAFEKAKKDKNWRKLAQYELDMLKKGF